MARTDVRLSESCTPMFDHDTQSVSRHSPKPDWFHHRRLTDGSDYVRWTGLFEFLISPDGRHITCHALNGASQEIFHTYLVGQVLSLALIKQGVEPLHATVVDVGGQAVAFLGDCGYGKSTLGAAFLEAGYKLLTDDLLVVEPQGLHQRRVVAHPGPPRIKLFPRAAAVLLGNPGCGMPMNPDTPKLVIPLLPRQAATAPRPLNAVYVLSPPPSRHRSRHVTIRTIPPRRACLALIANTFNTVVMDSDRLARQFDFAVALASKIPVKSLSGPWGLSRLPAIRDAILADLSR